MASKPTLNPSGSITIKCYAGMNPTTKKQRQISTTLPAGSSPEAIITASAELEAQAAVLKGNSSTMTLSAALAWCLGKGRSWGFSPGTLTSYRSYIRKHVGPRLGGVYCDRLQGSMFEDMYDLLCQPHDSPDSDGAGLSAATVKKIHSMLRGFFKRLVIAEKIPHNPLAYIERPRPPRNEVQPLMPDDYATLVTWLEETLSTPVSDAAGFDRFALASMVWLDLHTGLRRGELSGAQETHWTTRGGEQGIRVARVLVYDADSPDGILAKEPKSQSSRRFVETDERTNAHMESYSGLKQAVLAEHGVIASATTPLFCHADGSPWKPAEITSAFRDLVGELQIEPWVHLHTLRHTHASYLLDSCEATLDRVKERLGHQDVSTTGNIYSHMLPGSGSKMAKAAGRITERMSAVTATERATTLYAPLCPVSGHVCARFQKEES